MKLIKWLMFICMIAPLSRPFSQAIWFFWGTKNNCSHFTISSHIIIEVSCNNIFPFDGSSILTIVGEYQLSWRLIYAWFYRSETSLSLGPTSTIVRYHLSLNSKIVLYVHQLLQPFSMLIKNYPYTVNTT